MKKIVVGWRRLLQGVALTALAMAGAANAMQPPRPGELQQLAAEGELADRQQRAEKIGNHRLSPQLIERLAPELMGDQPAPPSWWQGGLPAKGNVKTLVLLVDFAEYPHAESQSVADVQSKMFGSGNPASFPYESLTNYYSRASYSQLNISGSVLGWYRASQSRAYYAALDYPAGNLALVKEALNYFDAQGHDFSQYDNDGDGYIDSLFLKWTGPNGSWASFWWAYQGGLNDPGYTIDGKHLGSFVWSWYAYNNGTVFSPHVDIHETGHLLGLPDYYDYDDTVGPDGGVGGLDMMDGNWGDHNCFSKTLLEWLTPTIITAGSQNHLFTPSGYTSDCVLLAPSYPSNYFSEYFLVQYRRNATSTSEGNDESYPTDGLVVWHVDAQLDPATGYGDYLFDNSYTSHKLLRLMEADGLEEIEASSASADAGDFYTAGRTFTATTSPNSSLYSGAATGLFVDTIGAAGASVSARVGLASATYTLSVTKSGSGTVTSSPAGINCGATCSYDFTSGILVTLTATPAAGYRFAGWGGACVGSSGCEISMTGNAAVSATFVAADGRSDLNGDGKGDIIWYNSGASRTDAWLMNGTTALSTKTLLVMTGWQPVAQGDFNGDGKGDILWYNASLGATDLWLMNGTTRLSSTRLLTNLAWRPVAAGDMNGDGKDDIVWYNSSIGATDGWLMNGSAKSSSVRLLTYPGWQPVALGDMNGDGKDDIVWYNSSLGATDGWLMNGLTKASSVRLLTYPGWQPLGTGDLNGDGKADIIWYNHSLGATDGWLMNGLSKASSARLLTYPGWKPVAATDTNGDGKADIVWNNASSGGTDLWLMNGLAKSQSVRLFTSTAWRPIGFSQ